MSLLSAARARIEGSLNGRIPGALSPRLALRQNCIPCCIQELDAAMQGGLAEGAITELVGAECSGRTGVALACLAAVTRRSQTGAWVDSADRLDPDTAAANGVDLKRLLWVRCGAGEIQPVRQGPTLLAKQSRRASEPSQVRFTGGSAHPRVEGRDMPEAIRAAMTASPGSEIGQLRRAKRQIGTPGAPNRRLTGAAVDREEQVNSDRLPARRGDNLALHVRTPEPGAFLQRQQHPAVVPAIAASTWQALDQALRATDLLLQAGGFGMLVLDLGSTPAEMAWRVPVATWFRFRAACERTRTSLLLLSQYPCARSSAALVLRMQVGRLQVQGNVVTGIEYDALRERGRKDEPDLIPIRKPPQSANKQGTGGWTSRAAWIEAG